MKILLSNDDGIHAPGLAVLEEIARELSDDILICAPAEEQSGAGRSLSLNHPVRLVQHGERRFSVTGTPTDAVNLAMRKLLHGDAPDLVLSGVNRGENLGDDITYSGTVSAGMEAALAGLPAVALSQSMRGAQPDFAAARAWGAKVLKPLVATRMAKRTLININFPSIRPDDVRGVRVVRQGFHDYSRGSLVEGTDPRGKPYYWFGLHDMEHTVDHGTDLEAVADGYIAVTPLQLDLTNYPAMDELARRLSP